MMAGLQALVPILAWFLVGVILRATRVVDRQHGRDLFRLVFFATLPALAFETVSASELSTGSLALPVAGFFVNLFCSVLALVYARLSGADRRLTGTVLLGAGITNTVFMFPFVLVALGSDALAQAILYDVGNAVFVAAVALPVSAHLGSDAPAPARSVLGRVLRIPLFLSILAAVAVSVAGWELPTLAVAVLQPLGATTPPLILVGLGVSFSTARLRDSVVFATVSLRMLGGLAAGALCLLVFGFSDVTATIVLALAAAPIGFNSVTVASVAGLDTEHALASLSVSIVLGLVAASAFVLLV